MLKRAGELLSSSELPALRQLQPGGWAVPGGIVIQVGGG
jgi:hypothetical protein